MNVFPAARCEAGCPVNAISEGDGKYVIDADTCIDCGACADACPVGRSPGGIIRYMKKKARRVCPAFFLSERGSERCFRWGEHLEALGNGVSVWVNETHHFGTDAILLADFCLPVKGKQAAELGAGCGAISMIWLREQPPAHITAVEIREEDRWALLRRTVKYNEKEELVTVLRRGSAAAAREAADGRHGLGGL